MVGILHDKPLHVLVYHKELLIFNVSSIYHEAYIHLMDISCMQIRGRDFYLCCCPGCLWGPPSQLCSGCRGLSSQG